MYLPPPSQSSALAKRIAAMRKRMTVHNTLRSHTAHVLELFKMSSAPSAAELLHVGGERTTGENIRMQNGREKIKKQLIKVALVNFFSLYFTVTACTAIANIVKSSLGPVGLDKMLVDDIGVSFMYGQDVYLGYLQIVTRGDLRGVISNADGKLFSVEEHSQNLHKQARVAFQKRQLCTVQNIFPN